MKIPAAASCTVDVFLQQGFPGVLSVLVSKVEYCSPVRRFAPTGFVCCGSYTLVLPVQERIELTKENSRLNAVPDSPGKYFPWFAQCLNTLSQRKQSSAGFLIPGGGIAARFHSAGWRHGGDVVCFLFSRCRIQLIRVLARSCPFGSARYCV